MGDILYTNFGNGLKRCRKNKRERDNLKKYTQDNFAEDFGVSTETVRNWEQGRGIPHTETLLDLCDFFDCSMDYLFMMSDVKRHDVEALIKCTGLSEESVDRIAALNKEPHGAMDALNFLICSPLMDDLTHRLNEYGTMAQSYYYYDDALKHKANDDQIKHKRQESKNYMEIAEYHINRTFSHIIDEFKDAAEKHVKEYRRSSR